jgi:formate dehydrogenase major subunit
VEDKTVAQVAIDVIVQEARPDELVIDLIGRTGASIPHVCYHPQLGPVQTCDTCMVEADGRLLRACATRVADGMKISTKSAKASAAQVEAFDRILSNHLLYCTVCDNNNGNCTVHNTTKLLAIEHQPCHRFSTPAGEGQSSRSSPTTQSTSSGVVADNRGQRRSAMWLRRRNQ